MKLFENADKVNFSLMFIKQKMRAIIQRKGDRKIIIEIIRVMIIFINNNTSKIIRSIKNYENDNHDDNEMIKLEILIILEKL